MDEQFSGQRDDEDVVLVFRRHPFVLAKGFLILIVLSALGNAPYFIVPDNQYLLYITAGGVVVGLLVFFYHWIGWYFSIYVLTNQRIRQNIQKGLFHKSVVDLGLNKIQSAYVKISGFLGNMLGYGTIILHTQVGDLHINKVASAESVYGKIQEEIGKVEYEDNSEVDE